jgi:hypothetical protein
VTELSSGEVYGTQYLEYLRGYFYAAMDGNYTFWGLGDDQMIVRLAKYQNNSNSINMETIIQI